MKPIELTKKQEEKLLEMCKAVFPKYKRIEVDDYQIDVERNHHNPMFVDLYKGKLTVPYNIYSIPWFEFCLTHLAMKISSLDNTPNPKKALDLNFFLVGVMHRKIHPVTYLYEQFKKLK